MNEETPKLFTNKPKKKAIIAQLKHVEANFNSTVPPSSAPSPAAAAAASYMAGSAPPPPPPPPKESFARRYKYVWPLLLTVNLAVGGYLFFRTKKKVIEPVDEEMAAKSAPVTVEKPVLSTVVVEPVPVVVKAREPIPEKQQRELFKWMLDEKRKVNPKSAEEKKRIEEEKAILKQFIRSKTIPTL
ncbi:hypothetical protein V5N11_015110 [Cardamine amara subsp. amara]|uniref:Uncharacterized protein n=1 Tax=Cardamine amara subsp. amara TaxID=228776 RepID=A0ABD1A1S8_CARAN